MDGSVVVPASNSGTVKADEGMALSNFIKRSHDGARANMLCSLFDVPCFFTRDFTQFPAFAESWYGASGSLRSRNGVRTP